MMYAAGNNIITIDIFAGMQIAVICSAKGLHDFVKENWPNGDSDNDYIDIWNTSNGAVCMEFVDGDPHIFMMIRNKSHRVVVHESVHLASLVMNQRGIPQNIENDEIMAYLTDHIFTQVCGIVGLMVK